MDNYSEYIVGKTNELINACGGIRAVSKMYGVDPAVISRVARGKYIPKPKTFAKWFNEDENNLRKMEGSEIDPKLAEIDKLIEDATKKRNEILKHAEERKLIKEATALCEKLNDLIDKLNKFEEL